MKHWNQLIIVPFILTGVCIGQVPVYSNFPKFDVHFHTESENAAIAEVLKAHNFSINSVAVGSQGRSRTLRQNEFSFAAKKQAPDRVVVTTAFSMENFGKPFWAKSVIDTLLSDFKKGVRAVKIWKDIGMTFRRPDSSFVMVDDPEFDSILTFIEVQDKTLLIHAGEPKNCWLPVEKMTVNNDKHYFSTHPQYHMYLHPDYPTYHQLINSRNNMLKKHPRLRVIGCHMASLEWNVDTLAACLDSFPNLTIDLASRVCHWYIQDRQKVKDFIIRFQDRIIYGSDLDFDLKSGEVLNENKYKRWIDEWNFFATDKDLKSSEVDIAFRGLMLPAEVLRKIYFENARKWLGGF
jgi:predicted TIM-barrel fold metal-dependent hydrolase